MSPHLTTEELIKADNYWISLSQKEHFSLEIESLENDSITSESGPLFMLHPFVDFNGMVPVGGRVQNTGIPYNFRYAIIYGVDIR